MDLMKIIGNIYIFPKIVGITGNSLRFFRINGQ